MIERLTGLAIHCKKIRLQRVKKRKIIIEDLEANLTGTPIDVSNTDDLAVAEEENDDEAITAKSKLD